MPLHTVAASARSLRFLEHSTRLLRTFSARSLRTHRVKGTQLPGSGCLCTRLQQAHARCDSSNTAHGCYEHSAHGRYEHIELRAHGCQAVDASAHGCSKRTLAAIPRTQHTVATNIQRTVATNTSS